jgi:hypothetical protein
MEENMDMTMQLARTLKGHEEIFNQGHTLRPRLRQILFSVGNGISFGELRSKLPNCADLETMVDDLLQNGFIESLHAMAAAQSARRLRRAARRARPQRRCRKQSGRVPQLCAGIHGCTGGDQVSGLSADERGEGYGRIQRHPADVPQGGRRGGITASGSGNGSRSRQIHGPLTTRPFSAPVPPPRTGEHARQKPVQACP